MTTLHKHPTVVRALSQAATLGIALLLSGCVLPFSTLETPSGLYTTNVTYSEIQISWSGLDTSGLVLEVERSQDGTVWSQAGLINPGQTTFVDQNLDCGVTYFYRVRARNANGVGVSPYSEVISGTTEVCLPAVATPLSPTSLVEVSTPTFTWRAAASAVSYRLIINGASGLVFEDNYDTEEVCVGDRCSMLPDVELERGVYSWLVEAQDDAGSRTTSSTARFDVDVPEAPTAPSLISPSGTVTTNTPTFTWSEVPGATWYYLKIDGLQETLLGQWYSALDVCPGEVCSLTVTRGINNGTYTWSMQARNSLADGPFSAVQRFVVEAELAEPPGAAELLDPEGTIDTGQPTFRWNAVERATRYQLLIDGPEGLLIHEVHTAQEVCTEGICSVTPEIALGETEYTWRIQAQNDYGDGPEGEGLAFTVDVLNPPPAVAPTFPNTQITYMIPRYYWNAAPEAAEYQLQVYRGADKVVDETYNASSVCSEGQCTAQPNVLLTHASYRWRIRARNESGEGPWSNDLTFNVYVTDMPTAPDPVYPDETISDRTPTYSWDAVDEADDYQIDIDGPDDYSFSHWYDADDVCSGSVCEVNPGETLDYGNYTWRVRARNEAGTSDWSDEMDFEVQRREPGTPDAISPSGNIGDDTPRLRWETADRADEYQVQIRDSSHDEVFSRWYDEDDVCDDGECSRSIPDSDALPDGDYEWRVRARNNYDTGNWSSLLTFTVDS